MLVNVVLIVIGAVAAIAGVITVRNADNITDGARQTLSEMFEASRPELFAEPTSSAGARGTGIGFVIFGLVLIGIGVMAAILGVRWGA